MSYIYRGWVQMRIQDNVEPLRVALHEHGDLLNSDERKGCEAVVAQREHRYEDAAKILDGMQDGTIRQRELAVGMLYLLAGDSERAKERFRRVEANVQNERERDPGGTPGTEELSNLAMAQSFLGKHEEAIATVDQLRARFPESRDAINGPEMSALRSFVLVRAGRLEEGHAEARRLLRVPYGSPTRLHAWDEPILFLVKDDAELDELFNHPLRL
jgi:hypothetical protein